MGNGLNLEIPRYNNRVDDDHSSPLDRIINFRLCPRFVPSIPQRCPNSIVNATHSLSSVGLTTLDSTRKATGVRLGQLVQRDLKKKERSTTANRDPHLELNISGKPLGEEGIKVVCGT
jgi:hypothetical protein